MQALSYAIRARKKRLRGDSLCRPYRVHGMDLADAIEICLTKPGAEETIPFGPEVLVYKVGEKMFATAGLSDDVGRMNLKCDPERAADLRERYEAILPGYHMNKRHWNTIVFDGSLEQSLVEELIDMSYRLVVQGLSKTMRERFQQN